MFKKLPLTVADQEVASATSSSQKCFGLILRKARTRLPLCMTLASNSFN